MNKINQVEVGTLHGVLFRQMALVIFFLFLLLLGYLAQKQCALGIDDWFARSGAIVVGLVIASQSLDAAFGWFSGFRQTNLAPHFASYIPRNRFAIFGAFFAVLATFVWGFGDLMLEPGETMTC
ncbi:hypothetical protein [Roseovarius sp. A-2]|uniref:hypothetical protein n=1 Tax=Roseovarius sp. A-2 TaxID=1570360 RepID=UPI00111BB973|nr:hypothetical protein [Roseovarius sp. A-2]